MPTIQVLDKAVVPEVRMPRGIKGRIMLAAAISFVGAFFAAFLKESLQKKGLK